MICGVLLRFGCIAVPRGDHIIHQYMSRGTVINDMVEIHKQIDCGFRCKNLKSEKAVCFYVERLHKRFFLKRESLFGGFGNIAQECIG